MMNIKQYLIPVLAGALLTVSAGTWTSVAQAEPSKNSKSLTEQKEQMNKTKVLKDAVTVLEKTNTALQQLEKGKKQQALDTLALITGKLELLVAQHPDLALAPVDVKVIAYDFLGSKESVKDIRNKARKFLNNNQIQDARHLLRDVASELVVRTTSLPLLTYPDAIKAVAPLIQKDDISAAKIALQSVLSTVVVTDDIIPLPVLRAQTALKEAKQEMMKKEKVDASKQRKVVQELLSEARKQLEWAQTLGYGDKDSFKALYNSMDEIEQSVAKGEGKQGLFDRLSETIKNMF
jgi:hypothetical protein